MKKIKLYTAVSLNGKIARKNGDVDWLDNIPNPDESDYGYYAFYNSIDTVIQGNNTYRQVLNFGIDYPYADKENYVLTRNQSLTSDDNVTFITADHIDRIREIKQATGGDIWLVGGGQINTLLWNAGLIDEIILHVMPIIIPDGIELFDGVPSEMRLTLTETKRYYSGVMEMKYLVGG